MVQMAGVSLLCFRGGGGRLLLGRDGGRNLLDRAGDAALGNMVVGLVEACRDHRDVDNVAEGILDDLADDDVRVGIDRFLDKLGCAGELLHREVRASLEGKEDAAGAARLPGPEELVRTLEPLFGD